MAPRKQKAAQVSPALPPQLATANLHAAGIDSGAEAHFVAVPPSDDPQPVRSCGAYTADLEALADWLATCGITTVALALTGVYWIPLLELLETRGFAVLLVDPQQVQKIRGRLKSDVYDCQWIQRLHTFGLLARAFRPADQVCGLRSYRRHRAMLLTYAGQHIQHMQKALTQMHIKLQHVVSDLTGVTGMAIIRAILAGERDPVTLARLRDYRCQHSEETLAKALYGQWREEPLFALAQAGALYEVYHQQMLEGDRQIEAHLSTCAEHSPDQAPPSPPTRKRNQPTFDVRGSLQRVTGVDLTTIEGIDDTTALIVISEVGLDMSRWPTVKHFTSWLGLCPHQQVSGGKVLSRRTKSSADRVATALRLGAACLHHRHSALGAFFHRMKARLGTPKAITATAHKLARLIYTMLKHGTTYVQRGMDDYEQQYRERAVQSLTRRAKAFGYTLVQTPVGTHS